MLLTIAKSNKEVFDAKLNKLNNKLSAYNEKIEVVSIIERTVEEKSAIYTYFDIEITEPSIIGKSGVVYKGCISFKDGHKSIFSLDENVILGDIDEKTLTCEHCNIDRFRNLYYFFEENGVLKSIGSTCVNDYFGYDIERFLKVFNGFAKDIIEDDDKWRTDKIIGHDVVKLISYLAYITDNFKLAWISKAKTMDGASTSDRVMNYMYSSFIKEDIEIKNFIDKNVNIDEIKEKVFEKYSEVIPTNDFEHNIKEALFYDKEGVTTLRAYTPMAGVFCYAVWKVMNELIVKEMEDILDLDLDHSEYVSNVSEKIEIEGTIINHKYIESDFGYAYLIYIQDNKNNILKAFVNLGTKAGIILERIIEEKKNFVKIKGTVKKHEKDMYLKKGAFVPVTVLNRLSFI